MNDDHPVLPGIRYVDIWQHPAASHARPAPPTGPWKQPSAGADDARMIWIGTFATGKGAVVKSLLRGLL